MANYIGADRGFQYLFDAVDDVKNDIAEQYDSTATYAVGDYVLYENILYKCITAVSAAESFDNTKWTQVVLTDQIAAGGVSDVQIDSVSVVSGGIANIPSMTGATTASAGTKGLIPAPTTADGSKFFKGDGTWSVPPSGSTVSISPATTAGTKIADFSIDGVNGELYAPSGSGGVMDVQVDGISVVSGGVATIDTMIGAITAVAGAKGLVPAPLAGDEDKYLKGDGTWAAVQAGAGALSGLSDVDLATPTDGQALVYDGANSKWINGNVSGGGGAEVGGMDIYEGAWTATSSSATMTPLTEEITLSAGRYLIVVTSPFTDANVNFDMQLLVNGVSQQTLGITSNFSARGQQLVTICTLSSTSTIRAASCTSRSVTWDSAYLERGFIRVVRLANLQTALIYSEDEREVGVWTDGKPLYQKTYVINSPQTGDQTYSLNISNLEKVVHQFGTWTRTWESNSWTYDLNADNEVSADYSYQKMFRVLARARDTDGMLYTWVPSSGGYAGQVAQIRLTIQYTKTTDVAGSGTWTTTGEYAHHYSTSEKVVGTWIDGSTLYERTWVNDALTSVSGGKLVASGFTDASNIIDITGRTKDVSGNSYSSLNGIQSVSGWQGSVHVASSGDIMIYGSAINNITGAVVTIRYTKTTVV